MVQTKLSGTVTGEAGRLGEFGALPSAGNVQEHMTYRLSISVRFRSLAASLCMQHRFETHGVAVARQRRLTG